MWFNSKYFYLKNYGNEKDVYELLYPHPFNVRGLDDPDFENKVDKNELKSLLKNKTFTFPDEEFETIFEITRQNEGANCEKISYKGFMETIRNLKRDYIKYRTMFN